MLKDFIDRLSHIKLSISEVKWRESCSVVSDSLRPRGLYSQWNSPGQNTGVGSLSLLQRIFPPQGSNPCLPLCRQILYQLGHKGSPRILEGVAYPFSSRSSWPRNRTRVSCIAGGFFTNWVLRVAPINEDELQKKKRKKEKRTITLLLLAFAWSCRFSSFPEILGFLIP